ncbi:MAG: RpiB/LacA/LacB family sugar-phosphate isomerase [Erysipelotrichales bacterium]|nr:RpiB/LacA/LacB family sugar-phosphate isomerase [Erysipelotrichales bacterium]
MKLGIATDHNGVEQKKEIINYLENLGYEVVDYSPNNTPGDDYPIYAKIVCENVLNKNVDLGILMCGTGIGMSIAANKIKGIRCAKVSSTSEASLTKEHNNSNVIALNYTTPIEELKNIIKVFIETPFSFDERHIRRISLITELEGNDD